MLLAQQPHEEVSPLLQIIEGASLLIEILAVTIIVASVLYLTIRFGYRWLTHRGTESEYRQMKNGLGAALLLGLEILVAADIVRTVVLEPTVESVAILGVLVLVRTFLSWSLVVEMEGHWPWKKAEFEAVHGGNEGHAGHAVEGSRD